MSRLDELMDRLREDPQAGRIADKLSPPEAAAMIDIVRSPPVRKDRGVALSTRTKIKYYDLSKNWQKVRPHLDNPRVVDTLVRDFNKFTYGRWRQRFTAGRYPREFESCDF